MTLVADSLVLAMFVTASHAHAEPAEGPSISWVAPAACPGVERLRGAIERRLGRPLADDELRLSGVVANDLDAWSVTLQLATGDRTSTRTLAAADCSALTEAAALIAAVSLDAVQAATMLEQVAPAAASPSTSIAPRDVSAPVAPRAATLDDDDPPRQRRTPTISLAFAGGVGVGATPAVAAAVVVQTGAWWRRGGLALGGHWLSPRTAAVAGGSVTVQLGTADLRGCGRFTRGAIDVPLCAGVELGAMRGRGSAAPSSRTRVGLWLGALASLELWGRVHRNLDLGIAATASVPLQRPSFQLRSPGPAVAVFAPAPVVARVVAGIRVMFGRR
ncbi:MAG: hypothetical protein IPH07_21635 [Deltaproteobacteria bacterium]|nr:hypothetical protein [Deltaproteobacteria bacterium]MBK8239690.1 hypothetical protein [Deltaproteobacteria bacterium]MBP7290744.1 hypothetical protein [Nannocystaceae bacterium]